MILSLAAVVAVDVYLHSRFEKSAGFNIWGYRGPIAKRKQVAEYRVAVLGGSAAFGYGVFWDEAFPAMLERRLAEREGSNGRITVVNLGYNNEGAYSFRFTLEDYLFLDYDLALLYEGYNDMMGGGRANLSVFRHDSPVFRLTGYLPIFPIVFKEKAAAMLAGGDPAALYRRSEKILFRPGFVTKATAAVLTATAEVGQTAERQLGRVTAESPRRIADAASTGCRYPWQEYCRSVFEAVHFATRAGKQVLVITQPRLLGASMRDRHSDQQREMSAMLRRAFGANPRVQYLSLADAVDLADPALSFDGMHLTVAGNARIAAALVQPVLELRGSK
jgi:hypothetical protein